MAHGNVPVVSGDFRHYWLAGTDEVVFDGESLLANYPREWVEAVKTCFEEHNDWNYGLLSPEGIMFAGYIDDDPANDPYACKECGEGDHVCFAMQYNKEGNSAIYGVHNHFGQFQARCYAD